MSASESEPNKDEPGYVEDDGGETQLGYGEGRIPFYVAVLWVVFLLAYATVMVILALPDLQAWSSR